MNELLVDLDIHLPPRNFTDAEEAVWYVRNMISTHPTLASDRDYENYRKIEIVDQTSGFEEYVLEKRAGVRGSILWPNLYAKMSDLDSVILLKLSL